MRKRKFNLVRAFKKLQEKINQNRVTEYDLIAYILISLIRQQYVTSKGGQK